MKKKVTFLKLFMPLIVLFAILFPAIHSYQHIHSHTSAHKISVEHTTDKSEFRVYDHENEQCSICHFKISPAATFSFPVLSFFKCTATHLYVAFYSKTYSNFFKGALFALRAPPAIN